MNRIPEHLGEGIGFAELPELVRIDELLSGFEGEASSPDGPEGNGLLRIARTEPESPRPAEIPQGVKATWPDGQTLPQHFEYRRGRWRSEIELPLPWWKTVELLREKKIFLEAIPASS